MASGSCTLSSEHQPTPAARVAAVRLAMEKSSKAGVARGSTALPLLPQVSVQAMAPGLNLYSLTLLSSEMQQSEALVIGALAYLVSGKTPHFVATADTERRERHFLIYGEVLECPALTLLDAALESDDASQVMNVVMQMVQAVRDLESLLDYTLATSEPLSRLFVASGTIVLFPFVPSSLVRSVPFTRAECRQMMYLQLDAFLLKKNKRAFSDGFAVLLGLKKLPMTQVAPIPVSAKRPVPLRFQAALAEQDVGQREWTELQKQFTPKQLFVKPGTMARIDISQGLLPFLLRKTVSDNSNLITYAIREVLFMCRCAPCPFVAKHWNSGISLSPLSSWLISPRACWDLSVVLNTYQPKNMDPDLYLQQERQPGCLRPTEPMAKLAPLLMSQLLAGIAYLQSAGIAHRDIKPTNLFLYLNEDIALLQLGDLGLACLIPADENALVARGGSPRYQPTAWRKKFSLRAREMAYQDMFAASRIWAWITDAGDNNCREGAERDMPSCFDAFVAKHVSNSEPAAQDMYRSLVNPEINVGRTLQLPWFGGVIKEPVPPMPPLLLELFAMCDTSQELCTRLKRYAAMTHEQEMRWLDVVVQFLNDLVRVYDDEEPLALALTLLCLNSNTMTPTKQDLVTAWVVGRSLFAPGWILTPTISLEEMALLAPRWDQYPSHGALSVPPTAYRFCLLAGRALKHSWSGKQRLYMLLFAAFPRLVHMHSADAVYRGLLASEKWLAHQLDLLGHSLRDLESRLDKFILPHE